MSQPGMVVFDLDFTLWDCGGTWCDCLSPPFTGAGDQVFDTYGHHIKLYGDVLEILDELDAMDIPMALASRTERPNWARQLLDRLGIRQRFELEEIFPSRKVKHLNNIREASGVELQDMLFFDDEMRNLHDLRPLGVKCVFVSNGLNERLFREGLALFE